MPPMNEIPDLHEVVVSVLPGLLRNPLVVLAGAAGAHEDLARAAAPWALSTGLHILQVIWPAGANPVVIDTREPSAAEVAEHAIS